MKFMRKTAALLLAVLMLASVAVTAYAAEDGVSFTEVNETVYALTGSNIRSGPGTQYEIIGQLKYGFSINRVGIGDNGWSMVLFEDGIGYIYSSLLTLERPKDFTTNLDDGDLLRQIAIANGLNRADYTDNSWQVLTNALATANDALNGNSQTAADAAVQGLQMAISGLVKMNYSALEDALAATEDFSVSGEMNELWFQLVTATNEGKDLLRSGDQDAVDAATAEILSLLEQIQAGLAAQEAPGVITQEVQVEVPPTDDYCNIASHRLWMVLFFVSLAVNVVLIAVMALYIHQKKKNRQDTTPLVDYDIYDDLE